MESILKSYKFEYYSYSDFSEKYHYDGVAYDTEQEVFDIIDSMMDHSFQPVKVIAIGNRMKVAEILQITKDRCKIYLKYEDNDDVMGVSIEYWNGAVLDTAENRQLIQAVKDIQKLNSDLINKLQKSYKRFDAYDAR